MRKIYTRDEAMVIVELFENVLDKYDITIPSDEDDERDPDNTARLYGSTYYGLVDAVENALILMLVDHDFKCQQIFNKALTEISKLVVENEQSGGNE